MAAIEALRPLWSQTATVALYVLVASLIYALGFVIYQLYLHPLAKFPGPKFAAVTYFYENHFQWSHEGTFPSVLDRLHATYGNFVRRGPDEIHITDPDCYDAIFNFSPDVDKRSPAGGRKPYAGGLFGQSTVEDSKTHRRPFNPPFSRSAVVKKESSIREKIDTIIEVLNDACDTDEVIDIASHYRALTTDAEQLYAIWRARWRRMARFESTGIFDAIAPLVKWVVRSMPLWISSKDDPGSVRAWDDYIKEMQTYIHDTLNAVEKLPKGTEASEASGLLPAFQEALRSRHAGPVHFVPKHLFANGNVIFLAGSETRASSMGAGTFHLLANPSILHRLQAELDIAWTKGTPSWTDLEQIHLLKGVVMETLRLDLGVSRRFARINWQSDTRLSHDTIFPDPQKFDPDRWTQSNEETMRLSKYMTPFSKGTRQCLAYSIAQTELYLTYAEIHRRFDLELVGTTREDVDCTVDRILSFPKSGKMTVKVKVKGKRGP